MLRIIGLVLFFIVHNAFADIQVKTSKTQLNELETLQLLIRISDKTINQQFDLTDLKQDFKIINQAASSSFRSINGEDSSNSELKFTLAPKRIGTLNIPAFEFLDVHSKPIKIQVLAANEADFEGNMMFVKTKLSNARPKLEEKVIYTMSLYARVDITNAGLDFIPIIDGANVKPLADSTAQKVSLNGDILWRKDFNFAIYPQKAGKLSIPRFTQKIRVGRSSVLLFAKDLQLETGS